ncbi:hypothetical protein G7Z17_g3860 [Cylindrodendrum hubeiense]|uniref:Methyltransferase domain-containing protein n=1 Tax=Cylindrodendrum hubeiense TaxID=595255 RepID=A0A9P5HF18_9HYPO|nr:hypothetical protein G7Z17_g3860 [Cylindrodendrum hubeiense]
MADIKEKIEKTYDIIAADYNVWTERNTGTKTHFLSKLMELLPTNQEAPISVLELGCGAGIPATKLLLSNPNTAVVANDMSAAQLGLAKKNLEDCGGDRVTWNQGDMMKLSFADNSLDAVAAMYSIIHLPRDEQTAMVSNIAKWLRPGGHLLANFMSTEAEASINPSWQADDGWMFWSGWGPERTLEAIKAAGLKVLESELRGDPGDSIFLWVMAVKE